MSIQGNFNNNLFQVAALTSMVKINEALSKFGISSIDELRSKIKDLEIEIAKAEDYGINPIKMKQLLNQYLEINKEYERQQEEEQEKRANAAGITIGIIVTIIFIGAIVAMTLLV